MSEELERAKAAKREHPVAKVMGWLVTDVCLLWLGWMARALVPQKPAGGPPMMAMMGGAGGPPLVEVQAVEEAEVNPPNAYIGRVEPIQDVELRAQIGGYVEQVHFKEGALVKPGDLLFTIDAEQYEARVAVRKAEIGQAEAALDRAERYLNRLERSDARAITQADLDTARSDVAQGRAAVKQAVANLALAEIDLKHTRIIAPIAGRVGRTVANVGDYVSPSLGALVRIVQVDPIRIAFSVTDKDYLKAIENFGTERVQDALRIRFRLPTGTVPDVVGARDYEDNTMSADTATLSVRARFPNAHGLLVPDGYVTVLVDLANAPKSPVVPQEALLTDREGHFVYVVNEAGIAQRRPVSIGAKADGRVAVRSGVKTGERVVVQGTQKVVHDQPVTLAPAKEADRK
ncbi:MAG TPA: efflux RND transporter periplasmic adaptor subunit [Kiritimatiellia bacterium]|nr:MAG: Efflux pump periplasmic linker BepF [Verrucomicrobia bacterium ADurb.Bin070]HPO37594.1 efflux RND transporter periplasmic adaptor subunit [Kiritimatiellia bacterium]